MKIEAVPKGSTWQVFLFICHWRTEIGFSKTLAKINPPFLNSRKTFIIFDKTNRNLKINAELAKQFLFVKKIRFKLRKFQKKITSKNRLYSALSPINFEILAILKFTPISCHSPYDIGVSKKHPSWITFFLFSLYIFYHWSSIISILPTEILKTMRSLQIKFFDQKVAFKPLKLPRNITSKNWLYLALSPIDFEIWAIL